MYKVRLDQDINLNRLHALSYSHSAHGCNTIHLLRSVSQW